MDRNLEQTFYKSFTTRAFATGIPTTLAGTPVISAYEDASLTQITAGITLGVDHDSVTGLNLITIVATAANGYEAGKDYQLVITTGTVGGVSVVGEVVGEFSIENTSSSLNVAALAALEDQYDGTGLTGDTYPATQSQLDSIANVGSAVNRPASSYTLTTGTQSANTYTSTESLDGTRHEHTDSAGVLDVKYHFIIGSGTPSSVQITGYVTGANDDVDVFGYDWVTAGYKQIGNINGSSSTSNSVYSFDLFVDMVGSGANEGKVDIMLGKTTGLTSATIAIDQIFVAFSQGVEGYDNGAVWFNSNASNTGAVVNIDGTARNPVSTSAALLALLASTGLHKIEITPGSTLTLGGAYEGYSVNGNGSVLALGTQNIGGSVFRAFSSVTGTGTTTGNSVFFEDCIFGTASLPPYVAQQCGYGTTVTQVGAGDYTHIDCYSTVAGAGSPTFTRSGAGTATGEYRRQSGGVTQSGITSSDTYTIGGELGTVTLNGASGSVDIRGTYKAIVDNRTGSPTLDTDGAIQGSDVSDTLADTNELQTDWANGGRLDLILDIIAADTTTDIPALIAALNDIAATDIVSGGAITTSAGSVANVTLVDTTTTNTDMRGTDSAATEAKQDATDIVIAELTTQGDTNETKLDAIDTVVDNLNLGIIYSTAATGTLSLTEATTNLSGYADDQLIGRTMIVTSGDADGEGAAIEDYEEISGKLIFTSDPLTIAMSNGDTFKIV